MSKYAPRLTADGIYLSKYYYDENIYPVLPNCTAYAWGRYYEISDTYPYLPTGNAGEWFPKAVNMDNIKTGKKPALGAIACFGQKEDSGHVAIVEEISKDGTFTVSQSGYYRPISEYPPDTPKYFSLATYNINSMPSGDDFYFQGFIYHPDFNTLDVPAWLLFKMKEANWRNV